jgi:hypothetical protein
MAFSNSCAEAFGASSVATAMPVHKIQTIPINGFNRFMNLSSALRCISIGNLFTANISANKVGKISRTHG